MIIGWLRYGVSVLLAWGLAIPFIFLQSRWITCWLQRSDLHFYFATRKKCVAITIDDAPYAGSTESILQTLARHSVKATFFIIGEQAQRNPDLMRAIVRDGHELGNHDLRDRVSALANARDLQEGIATTEALIKQYQPGGSKWFRPGVGFYSPSLLKIVRGFGFLIALADAYPNDVSVVGKIAMVLDFFLRVRVQAGSIVVLHDGRPSLPTAATLDRLLTRLHREGYTVGSLSATLERVCEATLK